LAVAVMAQKRQAAAAARRNAVTCTCGHAFSSHRQDPTDPWATERCKTCGCSAFYDGRRTEEWDNDDD